MASPSSIGAVAGVRVARPPKGRSRRLPARQLVSPFTRDPIRLALASLMLVSISRVHEVFPILAVLRPGLTLTAVCLGLAIIAPKQVRQSNLRTSAPMQRLLLFFGLAVVVGLLSPGPGASLNFLLQVLLPTIVFLALVTMAIRDVGDFRIIIFGYVLSMAILNYQAQFVWEFRTFGGLNRVNSTNMYDANDLGVIFAAGLPLAVLFAQTSARWGRLFGYAVALATPATVALTGSRGGFLGLLATGMGLLFSIPRISVSKRVAIAVVPLVVVMLAAPEGYFTKMNSILNPENDYNMTAESGRIAIWKRGLSYLAERPLTGIGAGNYVRAQWSDPRQTATGAPIPAMSSHNSFIQVLVETGIPVFLVWFSVLLMGTFGLRRVRRRLPVSWLYESPRRRFIYLAVTYLPVSYLGWSVSAFFVSHGYHVPFYVLGALTGCTLLLLRQETARPAASGLPA